MLLLRLIVGSYLLVHGFCHVVGFVVPWKIMTIEEEPYKTTLLLGKIEVGSIGIRVIGIFWLITAIAFVITAIGSFANVSWWIPTSLYIALFSLALCVFGLPGAKIGIVANIIIIVFLIASERMGWLSDSDA